MHFRRSQFAAAIMWGMIPLALLGSMPGAACICANGHYKLFCCAGALGHAGCNERNGGVTSPSASYSCPFCRGEKSASRTAHVCCSSGQSQSSPTGKCCQLVARSPAAVSAEVVPPASDVFVVAILPPALNLSLVVLPTISKHVEQIDTGPPIDRVIVLRCLLI